MIFGKIDLHCHSDYSDGLLSPVQLLEKAKYHHVELLALTDHDTVQACAIAQQTAQHLGIQFISGVEISACFEHKTVHIVGLAIDPKNVPLEEHLQELQRARQERAYQMEQKFQQLGIKGVLARSQQLQPNMQMLGRAHFARALVNMGIVSHVDLAFRHYLSADAVAYVPLNEISVTQAVEWIVAAGGVAVLAHPLKYRFETGQLSRLLRCFVQAGGKGIEVFSAGMKPKAMMQLKRLAKQWQLEVSIGSDFHGMDGQRLGLDTKLFEGSFVAEGLIPIWHRW